MVHGRKNGEDRAIPDFFVSFVDTAKKRLCCARTPRRTYSSWYSAALPWEAKHISSKYFTSVHIIHVIYFKVK